MRAWHMTVGLVVTTLGAGGCAVVIEHSSTDAPAPVVVTPGGAAREIDAAAAMDFESSRLAGLRAIAARQPLSPEDQVYLVNAIYTRLDFESSKLSALLTLIRNNSFCEAAKSAILSGLHQHLDFESSKTQVLKAIGTAPAT